jgi:hypothetical protein
MSEEAKAAKPKKYYKVHTTGGQLTIPAHDFFIDSGENRIYFLDASGDRIETWIVFLSNVAAIEITDPPTMKTVPLRM